MRVATPLETAWPAFLALAVLLLAAFRGRRVLAEGLRRLGWAGLAWFAAALLVRLVVIPALGAHTYDGHEAEYYDIFVFRLS